MVRLERALAAWGQPGFEAQLVSELALLDSRTLLLDAGMRAGSYVTDSPIRVIVKQAGDAGASLRVEVAVFFKSVIAGCSCADDPTPQDELDEFCELLLDIDKLTAVATISLLD